VLSADELLVERAVSVLNRELLAVSLSKGLQGHEAVEVGVFGNVGGELFDLEPLVVVALVEPQVNSVPNVSRGEVDSGAGASTANSEGVSVLLASDFLDLPLLSSGVIVMGPEVDISLPAFSVDAEVLSVAGSARDDVEGVNLAIDGLHDPAVLSLELDLLVEEGLLVAAVSGGRQLNQAVGLAERDNLRDHGKSQGGSEGESLNSEPLVVVGGGGPEVDSVPDVSCGHPSVVAASVLAEVSELESAGLVFDGLDEPLLVGAFRSEPVVNVRRAVVVSRKVGSVAARKGLDVVDGLLSFNGGEPELGVDLVVGGSQPGVVVAVSALTEVGQVVGLAERRDHSIASQSGSDGGVGVVLLNLEPLVVVVLGFPEVNSIPNVSSGEMFPGARTSSADGESVGILSLDFGEGPLLSAAVIVSDPEINIGLPAGFTNTEELSLAVPVADQVEGVELSRDWHSFPAVVSPELHVLVEEGCVFIAVGVGGELDESVSLSDGGELDD
jgi:hypothetical protein